MPEKMAENLLREGQELREHGETFNAVEKLNRAMEGFLQQKDYSRFAHALLDRAICWQHLYSATEDPIYITLYVKDAETMLEIAELKNIPEELYQAYFVNGKAKMLQKDFPKAVEFFTKAIDGIPERRAQQKGDWLTNLGKAIYLCGKKEQGQQIMLDGLERIKKSEPEEGSYETNVWASGGYLRLAEVLKTDDPSASHEYLTEAQKIIESDPNQVVRKQQLAQFIKKGETDL